MNSTLTEITPELCRAVLDDSLSHIYVAQPIRDPLTTRVIDFNVLVANQAFQELENRTPDELRQATLLTLFPQVAEANLFALYRTVVETGTAHRGQHLYPAAGGPRWIDLSVKPFGEGILVNFIDTSPYQEPTELQLRRSVERLDHILNVLPSGLVMTEAVRDAAGHITDFRLTHINPAAAQLADISPTDVGRAILDMDPVLLESGLFRRYVDLVETGEPFNIEYTFRGRDLALSVSRLNDGFVATFTDISERKRAEYELHRQTNLLQRTLDASISSILAMTAIRDESGQIVDFRIDKANRSVERSLNRSPNELEGRNLLEIFPANVETGFFAVYAKAADTGDAQHITLPYTDDNGFEGWFEVSAVQYAPDQIVLTFMNVTESKRLEAQLRDSNESLDRFASVASHDLQEPLRKIKSFGELLLDQYGPKLGDGVDFLLRMRSATERMQGLIRDLLSLSRLSKGADIARRPVDLNQIVADVLDDLEVAIFDKRATVELSDLPTLPGDPVQLRQVFLNLLSNALKFSKPAVPPRIWVTCQYLKRADIPADVALGSAPSQPFWHVSVVDEGIGFNERYRERIFEAFERLHGKKGTHSGTGIGLAIVQKVMQNHNGLATAHSREGEGATFSLYFPG